jgi:CubicO group peptidase (beta-lactamase class C family)
MDYARFSQMLLSRGRIDGVTVLSRKTVELMTADHLGTISHGSLAPGYGFGLGFAVRKADGLASVDPKEEIVAIWLAQHSGFPKLFHYRRTFKNLVMQAIVD